VILLHCLPFSVPAFSFSPVSSQQPLSPSLHRVWHITREETRTHGAFDAVAASRTREEGSITNPYLVLCIAPVQGGGAVPLLILRKAFHSQLLTQTVVPLSSSHRFPPRARPRPPPVPPLAPPVRACRPFGSSVHGVNVTTLSQSEESVHAARKKATARNRGTGSTPKLMIPYRRAVQRTLFARLVRVSVPPRASIADHTPYERVALPIAAAAAAREESSENSPHLKLSSFAREKREE